MFCRFVAVFFLAITLAACEFPSDVTPTRAITAVPVSADQFSAASPQPPAPSPQSPTSVLPPTATAVPQPTPTHDPDLPDWTVLVYMNADNNLERAGLRDVNEMEIVGSSDRVNVLVQIDRAVGETAVDGDWTETRRYRIRRDGETEVISSEPAAQLGEVNMGDPLVLADFITWGITRYPANRYALILWDHGAGWNGIAFDGDTAEFGDPDFISLPDLAGALAQTLAQTGVDRLDVIGFDACLMGQLDLFQTIAPFADYAVGSEALTPGQGWNYATLLGRLAADPGMDGAQLARQMAADFVDHYTYAAPDDFVTMSAVDLSQMGRVTTAVSSLAAALMADPARTASAVGDARSGAETYARAFADAFDRFAAIDLRHFAAILAQRSPDEAVSAAARRVMAGVETAVIANEHGRGFTHSGGMAIYFPRRAAFYDATYSDVTANAAWDAFLNSYHRVGTALLPPPELHLTSARGDAAGVQNPAYLDFQLVGREIEDVVLLGGRYEEDGRRRLLEWDTLIPEPAILPDGSRLSEWRDGVHEDFFIWDTRVTYLFDTADNGDFVVMRPAAVGALENGRLYSVQGRFRRAGATTSVEANLVFNQASGELARVWGMQSDAGAAPAEITPHPGDLFQVYSLYLDEANQIIREPGPELVFDEAGQLYFDWRPLPGGSYFLGLSVENVAGGTAVSLTDLRVDNDALLPGYEAYLDPYLGFQFLYPDTWYAPIYTGTLLYTSDRPAATNVQITLYPNLEPGMDAAALKAQTIAQFGPVDLLFEDETAVAGRGGLRVAYGYDADDGLRTGIFLAFVWDGTGYVVDVDGLADREAETITAVNAIASSWQFVPVGEGLPPGRWAQVDLAAFTVAQPADFVYQTVNDWQRFSSGRYTFIALRTQPATLPTPDVLAALLRDAGEGMADFTAEDPFPMLLGGAVWQRANFSYRGEDGRVIWGFIMIRVEDGQEVVAWAEAPSDTYNQLEQTVFLVMIADLSLAR